MPGLVSTAQEADGSTVFEEMRRAMPMAHMSHVLPQIRMGMPPSAQAMSHVPPCAVRMAPNKQGRVRAIVAHVIYYIIVKLNRERCVCRLHAAPPQRGQPLPSAAAARMQKYHRT